MAEAAAQQLHFQKFFVENVQHNAKQLYYVRSVFLAATGSAAGVLGLTNLWGFYFYLASVLVVNASLLILNARLEPSRYLVNFNKPPLSAPSSSNKGRATASAAASQAKKPRALQKAKEEERQANSPSIWSSTPVTVLSFLLDGLQEMAFSYVLWWTLFTALVHVYD